MPTDVAALAAALGMTPRPVPITPTEEAWRLMTPKQREDFIMTVNEALSDPLIAMSEGRPHKKAKSRALDMLGLHFRALGRRIYLVEELSVMYPGERGFTPDLMAVLDVEEPEDDQRSAWVVADEKKGLDWVLEVLWRGDRKKDLEENVEFYAKLGIPEYFVFDQKRLRLYGYRLPPGAKRYQPILAQAGQYRSEILGIDLAIVGQSLRFFQGAAELYDTTHLVRRLEEMVSNLEERAEHAEQEAQRAAREVERVSQDAQRATQDANKSRVALRKVIVKTLVARSVPCSRQTIERLDACSDSDTLERWAERAFDATNEADLFAP